MLRRVLFGLLKGAIVGGLLATAVVYGLGMPVIAPWLAYLAAVVTGAVTGLVAGKPIWTKDLTGRIEAGLKAAAGALVAAGAMFAVRRWLNVSLDLGALGSGVVGDLPIASLPLIATVLGMMFEIDNTGDDGAPPEKKRVDSDKVRIEELGDGAEEELGEDSRAASQRARRH